jgi:hypothetical protein
MWGMTNKEKLLLLSIIRDRDRQIEKLELLVKNERLRAEGAINLLLLRTVKAVLTPQEPETEEQQEAKLEKLFGVFGTENDSSISKAEEQKLLDDLQTLRTP